MNISGMNCIMDCIICCCGSVLVGVIIFWTTHWVAPVSRARIGMAGGQAKMASVPATSGWASVAIQKNRLRREQTLRGLAQRVAARVQETGLPFTLEAMPANERRIVHLTLANHPAVSTQSHGEGDQRRVVVSPKR